MKEYGTIKRGKQKFEIGSAQDKFLHTKELPHSHVKIIKGEKRIIRY